MKEITTRYDHTTEAARYEQWEKEGIFQPQGEGEPYSIITPPPNVTGDLHLGHALTYGLQDSVARHQRRLGRRVLMVPGADHAAIAVQALVEKKVQKEQGLSRTQLGKEKFLQEIYHWTEHYLPRVQHSLKRLGLSADWDHFRFTMDERSKTAVTTAFIELYKKGLIYRGEYMVNWDQKLQTAISDDEVYYEERPGTLYWVKYGPLTIATSRPETMFADVAVAVHPDDVRYQKYLGQKIEVLMPTGETKSLGVLADDFVDPKFGTGAVKITPAHDPTDFAVGKRHQLSMPTVIDQFGKLTELSGEFAGLKIGEAREKIAAKLQELGLLEKTTTYTARVPLSERSNAVVEPRVSTQWFMKTTAIKKEAASAVKTGKIKFTPKNLEKVYFQWLDNLHDWCISRQLWWGHEIPAWYCDNPDCPEPIVAAVKPASCPRCQSRALRQDPDVLDTWFSSGTWPFSTLGWPDAQSPDYKTYFPTSLLETGSDILFFWVSRMIMMSLALTNQIPFRDVLFHGLILDEQGKKMSKSKGNVMDPLSLIDQYGADALRMSLIGNTSPGLPQRYSEQKILKYRNFVTKIWNASRFVALMSEGAETKLPTALDETETKFFDRLDKLEKQNRQHFEKFKLSSALEELYEFFWHDFADQFLEYEKTHINGGKVLAATHAQSCLLVAVDRLLELLSDFGPFVCDAIRQEMLDE